jgi:hypothetical protein
MTSYSAGMSDTDGNIFLIEDSTKDGRVHWFLAYHYKEGGEPTRQDLPPVLATEIFKRILIPPHYDTRVSLRSGGGVSAGSCGVYALKASACCAWEN